MRKTLARRRIPLKYLLALGLGLAVAATASADTYPSRAINLVVPYPAGGASDIIARLVAERLQQALKQPVVVENRAGANGIIAYSHVAKSPADGYTLLMGNIGPSAINPSIYKKLPYDAEKDFAPITLVSWVPLMLVANPALGANTVQDVIAKAKARPGGLSYGVSGIGTAGHLAMELFKSNAGVNIQPINYKGDSPALVDTVAGHVDIMMATVVAATPYVAAGKLKAVAVTTTKRLAASPSIPAVAESGMPDFQAVSWGGILAPRDTPAPIIAQLNTEIVRILQLPDIKQRFATAGAEVVHSTPEEFARYIASETTKWGAIARAAQVSVE